MIPYNILYVLSFIFIIALIFIIVKFCLYCQKRKMNHDNYTILPSLNQCPNMDMFGLKYSVILCLALLNTFCLVVLVLCLYYSQANKL